jgi:outer membrane receptor protein involved in Fe transport
VRVTSGPASVLYGSNAMGGAIEIEPSRPEAGFQTRLTTSVGSWWTTQNRLHHAAQFDRAFYSLNAGYSGTSGERPSSDFRNPDLTVAGGGDFSPHWKASLQGRYGFFHVEDPGPVHAPLQGSRANVGRGGYSANLDNAYSRSYGYARLYGVWGRHFITDGFRSTDSTQGGRGMQSLLLNPDLTLDMGAEVDSYGGAARNVRQSLQYGSHRLTEGAGFTRARWNPTPLLLFTGGFRYHQHSLYGGMPVPEFHAAYRLSRKYSVAAGAARGFRNPTIRELYLFPAPNPQLQPETLWNYQATAHAQPWNALTAWTTFYYADLSNQVVTLGRFPNLALANSGSAINRGVETNAQWRPSRSWLVGGGYAYLRSTNLAPLIPQQKVNASLQWHRGRYTANLSSIYAGRRWANAARSASLGGYTLMTLQGSCRLTRNVSAYALIDNVLDRRYQILPGYPMPGVNGMGGLSWVF